ncbi:MAG: GNAT family N-acetyltransferase [Pseudomonadota bacterium]
MSEPTGLIVAGIGEAPVLSALHAACFDEPWSPQAMVDVLASPGAFAYLAMMGEGEEVGPSASVPAGFAIARVAAREAELLSLGVAPRFRRRGGGTCLLAEVLKRAVTAGARRVFLEVAADNVGARALYAAQGFAEVGRRPDYYRRAGVPPVNALTLQRALRGRRWLF